MNKIRITGTIISKRDHLNANGSYVVNVLLRDAGNKNNLKFKAALWNEEAEKAAEAIQGDELTIEGRVERVLKSEYGYDIELKSCVLISIQRTERKTIYLSDNTEETDVLLVGRESDRDD